MATKAKIETLRRLVKNFASYGVPKTEIEEIVKDAYAENADDDGDDKGEDEEETTPAQE
jgi:hypothetical protein